MKLQGMDWKNDDDEYVKQLEVCKKWIDGKKRIFDIMYLRYKDLNSGRIGGGPINTKLGYDLMANLSEVEKDKIDADYLEQHFRQILPTLIGDFEEEIKEMAIKEFQTQLASLSIIQQEYANIIIDDIRNERLSINDVKDKTLFELIAEYQTKAEEQKIKTFADTYGLDITILHKIYHTNGNHDIEIGKLLDNCDKTLAEKVFNCKWFSARSKLNKAIKEFIE
jgi:hypothetical protein